MLDSVAESAYIGANSALVLKGDGLVSPGGGARPPFPVLGKPLNSKAPEPATPATPVLSRQEDFDNLPAELGWGIASIVSRTNIHCAWIGNHIGDLKTRDVGGFWLQLELFARQASLGFRLANVICSIGIEPSKRSL